MNETMNIRPLRETEIVRFVEELWLPFHRELEALTETHELAEDVDLVTTETEYRRDQFDDVDQRAWVAVDNTTEPTADGTGDGDPPEFAGFLTAETAASPSVFDRPDSVVVNDVFVHEQHRGTGLANELLARAADWARDLEYDAIGLSVHVDNDRARAFYGKHGFEPMREQLAAGVDDI